MQRRLRLLPLILLVAVSGCLPYACNRTESRALTPADSLSRSFAAGVPVDTLISTGIVTDGFDHPRTLAFGPDGQLWVTDTGRNGLFQADSARWISLDSLAYPYMAGFRGSRPVVFSPAARKLAELEVRADTARVGWIIPLPPSASEARSLDYAVAGDSLAAFKSIAEDARGFIALLASDGTELSRVELNGPFWRYAGLLRLDEGGVLSLSGYRPLLHKVRPGEALDSMMLFGFDSPMLARSRSFMRGDLDQAPLLTASSVVVGDRLFVLNMRPGWLRIDVFDRSGRLERALVQPNPAFNRDYYPTDLAVRAMDTDYEIAITLLEPVPAVERFVWRTAR